MVALVIIEPQASRPYIDMLISRFHSAQDSVIIEILTVGKLSECPL